VALYYNPNRGAHPVTLKGGSASIPGKGRLEVSDEDAGGEEFQRALAKGQIRRVSPVAAFSVAPATPEAGEPRFPSDHVVPADPPPELSNPALRRRPRP